MTDRLKQLLGDEAHGLAVPPPTAEVVLRHGRGIRRRHRIVVGACAAAAAVAVGGSVVALSDGDGDADRTASDVAASADGAGAVFSYGTHVFYDGADKQAQVDDKAVKSLYYTSGGVVVRHGNSSASDGGGPQRFSLVTPEGDVRRLGLVTEETVHASDVDQPFLVYAEAVDGQLEVVLYDVLDDFEAGRVTIGPTREAWFPVAIDGETAYVQDGYQGRLVEVDWRTGGVDEATIDSTWEFANGRYATRVGGEPAVVDAATGDVLLSVEGPGTFDLSPDGRYADLVRTGEDPMDYDPTAEVEHEVYDVGTASSVTFTGPLYEWGWTPDGDLFRVAGDQVTTCDSATGDCSTDEFSPPPGPGSDELRLGGRAYES